MAKSSADLAGSRAGSERLNGAVAQLGERLVCNQEATGSIPVSSTKNPIAGVMVVRSFFPSGFFATSFFTTSWVLSRVHMRRGWWILWIPLVLVLIGGIIEAIKLMGEKRERKALLEEGVDPDTVAKKAPTLR